MATLDQIYSAVSTLKDELSNLIVSAKLHPKQITIVNGLSDISRNLGTVYAGEFLALSSGENPNDLNSTGTFMSSIGRIFDSTSYHIGGVHNGVIQWGANSLDGTLMAGQGSIVLTENGIRLDHTNSATSGIIWKGDQDTGNYYPFIHDFNHPTGGEAKPEGYNLFMGVNSGNFTVGSTATEYYHSSHNVGMGYKVLSSLTTGYRNIGIGAFSLHHNTTGAYNVGIGAHSLRYNTTGTNNIGVGYQSLLYNTTGAYNVGVGSHSLVSNTTGTNNTGIGYQSLFYNTTGTSNIGVGYQSLLSNTTGEYNVGVGSSSLRYNTTGVRNTGIGAFSLRHNTTGVCNTVIGYFSGYTIDEGNYNTFLGYESGHNDNQKVDAVNSTAIGANSYTTTNNQIVLGDSNVTSVATYGDHQKFKNSTTYTGYMFVPLTDPLTSTSWDGDSIADADYTLIDLSSVFGAPAGIKAVLVRVEAKDSSGDTSTSCLFALGPTDDETKDALVIMPRGIKNNGLASQSGIVPCNSDGDIYYRSKKQGTLTVNMQIWGYWI